MPARAFKLLLPMVAAMAFGCTVPALDGLGPRACDADAGHLCVDGYACVGGVCVIPGDGECTSGDTRPCGSATGECRQGTQTCSDGQWSSCVGAVEPTDERCNGKDDDCDGDTDEGSPPDALTFYADEDGDGHGNPDAPLRACALPTGAASSSDDCDDAHASAYPGAPELCDGLDNDCNGSTDEGITDAEKNTYYRDGDGDGFGDPADTVLGCVPPKGYVADGTDCDDTHPSVHPGLPEVCDELDNNCDGTVDEGVTTEFFPDQDRDGYGDMTKGVFACAAPKTFVTDGTDCDDSDPQIHPGAFDFCNGRDDDCNGTTDDPPELTLVQTAGSDTTALSWARAGTSLAAAYVETTATVPHVYFQSFDSSLASNGAAQDLSQSGALRSEAPSLAWLPGTSDSVVAWVDEISAGTQRVFMARVDSQGSLVWTSGGTPVRLLVASGAISGGPKVAVSANAILVAWLDTSSQLHAATYSWQSQLIEPAGLVSGLGTAITSFAVIGQGSDFVLGVTGSGSLSNHQTTFRRYDVHLSPASTANAYPAVGPGSGVALAVSSAAPNGLQAAWVEKDPQQNYRLMRTADPLYSSSAVILAGPAAATLTSLSGQPGSTAGTAWAWASGTTPEVVVRGSTTTTLTPSGTSSDHPAITGLGAGGPVPFVVGYEQDRGQSVDLYARIVCSP